jgi:hypothetical protein
MTTAFDAWPTATVIDTSRTPEEVASEGSSAVRSALDLP